MYCRYYYIAHHVKLTNRMMDKILMTYINMSLKCSIPNRYSRDDNYYTDVLGLNVDDILS